MSTRPLDNEPVAVIVGAGMVAVNAVLGAVVAFGVDLTADQTAAVVTLANAVAAVVLAVVARGRVWSPAGQTREVAEAAGVNLEPKHEQDYEGDDTLPDLSMVAAAHRDQES